MMVLILLYGVLSVTSIPPRSPNHWLWVDALWGGSPAPTRLCWIHALMVLWLWVGYRTPRPGGRRTGRATTTGLLASALILLILSWVVLATVASVPVPDWEITRIHP